MSDTRKLPEMETAHILYMDIVGYSLLRMPEQVRALEDLTAILRESAEFRRADVCGELMRIQIGDGLVLVFQDDPAAPLRCALEIARRLVSHPHIRLRMGINSGPVYRIHDINTNKNVFGEGINKAERVMDVGDAGHILLSYDSAKRLEGNGDWSAFVQDLGECEVKHGIRLRIFNLFKDGLGNPLSPERLASVRVALLYRRNAHPDQELLSMLESQLLTSGYRVFIDRHLTIGLEWAREIERQVRNADAVIPLLSESSMQSEMLAEEIKMAYNTAQQHGRPRILPVRVGYTGPLSDEIAGMLERVHYALWKGPEDDEQLLSELFRALQNLHAPEERLAPPPIEPIGGAVPLDSKFWILRKTESEFREAVRRCDSIILLKGARQMGKTSLLARGLQQAKAEGTRCVRTDFQKLNATDFESPDTLFMALGEMIADQLDLETSLEEVWKPTRGANANFERFLRREVLAKLDTPLLWALDEVDRLFTCTFASEIFGLFRSWHNERSLEPDGPWAKLTLAIAYATEAHLFITDLNQSPFNVGTRLTLEDFTPEQVGDLNHRYGSPLRDADEQQRFYRLLGGQPYLTQRGLSEMALHRLSFPAFQAQAEEDEGLFSDHLRRFLILLVRDPDLCDVTRGLLQGLPCPTAESFYRLRSAGILTGSSASDARIRCDLYQTYFSRHLLT